MRSSGSDPRGERGHSRHKERSFHGPRNGENCPSPLAPQRLPIHLFAMPTLKFAVLAGDYIGPEVMSEALRVLGHVARREGFALEPTAADVGGAAIDRHGKALPDDTLRLCEQSDAILFGSVGGPKWENLPPKEQPERAGLLYPELAAASPLKSERIPDGIDIVCIRELTGGLYFGRPKETTTLADGDVQAVDTMVYRKSELA